MELTADDIFDELAVVYDPEKAPSTLADLNVITREGVKVSYPKARRGVVEVQITPTVPHCHLMTAITLSVIAKLHFSLPVSTHWTIRITVPDGSHLQSREIERRANDKERVVAALESPEVMKEIRALIREDG
jgi:metal-sulfur cluster biosynthetic enzyme